jgi:hypothetical protein
MFKEFIKFYIAKTQLIYVFTAQESNRGQAADHQIPKKRDQDPSPCDGTVKLHKCRLGKAQKSVITSPKDNAFSTPESIT